MSELALAEETLDKALKDPVFKEEIQRLRQTDNTTNWLYLARAWFFVVLVFALSVIFFREHANWGLHWAWCIPVYVLAVIAMGANQHQLTGLAHEGSHFILFKNRMLNELVSDIFCMFPMYSNTHLYRLQHLAHHQFVNDPERDPDVFQMRKSGHWLHFPVTRQRFIGFLLSQFWVPNVLKFMLVRAEFSATGSGDSPYHKPGVVPDYTAVNIGIAMVFGNVAMIGLGLYVPMLFEGFDWVRWLALSPAVLAVLAWVIFPRMPDRCFTGARLHPPVSPAISMAIRISEIMLIWGAFTLWAVLGDWRAPLYYVALWIVPIFTSFSSFMMLRQVVQHGNGGRGWISNTRVFEVNPLLRYAVFPIGMDYHLPHHLFASVPHYRLHGLHTMLCRYPEYLRHAVEVHGYFMSPEHPQVHPTVVDVLGPEWKPGQQRIYIDNSVLEGMEVDDKDVILAEGKKLSGMVN